MEVIEYIIYEEHILQAKNDKNIWNLNKVPDLENGVFFNMYI